MTASDDSDNQQRCALRRDVLGHVGNKWSVLVMLLLDDEQPRRYSGLRAACGITARMLSLTLRELERDGLIDRTADGYVLTPAGRSLCPLVRSLVTWSDEHRAEIVDSRQRFAQLSSS